jgi:hypothetical protein
MQGKGRGSDADAWASGSPGEVAGLLNDGLTAPLLAVRQLRGGAHGPVPPAMVEALAVVERGLDRLEALAKSCAGAVQLRERDRLHDGAVPLAQALRPVVEALRPLSRERNVALVLEEHPALGEAIQADRACAGTVLWVALEDVVRAVPPRSAVRLAPTVEDGHVALDVAAPAEAHAPLAVEGSLRHRLAADMLARHRGRILRLDGNPADEGPNDRPGEARLRILWPRPAPFLAP